MLRRKKKEQPEEGEQTDSDEAKAIDFAYIQIICVNRMGYTPKNAGFLYFGEYVELFESYKKLYNFETKKMLYRVDEGEREVARLSDL